MGQSDLCLQNLKLRQDVDEVSFINPVFKKSSSRYQTFASLQKKKKRSGAFLSAFRDKTAYYVFCTVELLCLKVFLSNLVCVKSSKFFKLLMSILH